MKRLFLSGILIITIGLTQVSWAGQTAFKRIASTLNGGSGLFVTQSINTLAPGKLEAGLGLSYEDGEHRRLGDLNIIKFLSTVSFGLSPNIETSVKIPYFADIGPGKAEEKSVGDISLSVKWRFMEASTDLNFPGFGFHLTAFLPTGGERDEGTAQVDSWGLQLLLVSSAETEVGLPDMNILVGFYADGGVYLQDVGDPTEENSGIINLGLLVPLSESRELQLILEANSRVNREFLLESQHEALMGGLRYVTRHIAVNGGFQYRINQEPLDDSSRLILYGSYFF